MRISTSEEWVPTFVANIFISSYSHKQRREQRQEAYTKNRILQRGVALYVEIILGEWFLTDKRSKKTSGEDSDILKPLIVVNH